MKPYRPPHLKGCEKKILMTLSNLTKKVIIQFISLIIIIISSVFQLRYPNPLIVNQLMPRSSILFTSYQWLYPVARGSCGDTWSDNLTPITANYNVSVVNFI